MNFLTSNFAPGDSGSGLYKVDPDSKLPLCVYGVVSMGPGCDGWSDYNVFTRISYYMPELINTMYSSEVCNNSYYKYDTWYLFNCTISSAIL